MGWRDSIARFFRRQTTGQVTTLARGNSGEGAMPRVFPSNLDTGLSAPYQQLATMLAVDSDLLLRYADYENMDDTELISAALDVYADSATVADAVHGRVIWATSKDKIVRDIINDMLDRRIRIEDDLWAAVRTFCKYGNAMAEIVVNDRGVLGLNWLPPPTVRRIVNDRGELVGFVQDPTGMFSVPISTSEDLQRIKDREAAGGLVFFEPWEVVHWRMRGKQMRALYGFSMIDAVRWVWKRILMLEDNSLVMKLTKAPGRFAFYVDTGEIPPREAKALVDDVRRRYKKKRIVDPATGKIDFRFNPLEMCLSLDTRIPLLNSTVRTLRDLIMDHEAGVQNYVYSIDPETKHVKPGKISWAGVTRRTAQVVRVTLDNCQEVVATPDHQFLLRNGTYKEAQFLEPGDSVMPLYRGIANNGYEYVVHQDHRERGTERWKALGQTHRLVAEAYLGDPTGMIVHHIDERRRNNYPENLEVVSPAEHGLRHAGALVRRVRKWAKDHPGEIARRNRARNSGRHLIVYNQSPKHKADNAIRSEKIAIKYPDGLLPELRRMVQENPTLRMRDATAAVQSSPLFEELRTLNPNRKRTIFDVHNLRSFVQQAGYDDWRAFCTAATENHKVISVEWLSDTQDTGCITVDVWHNFALDAGIFVKNSEDFFVPTRGGKESTRIEPLAGPDYDETGVMEYFLKKLYGGLRIPPQYLGGTEVTNRSALTQEDVAFSRLIERVQREWIAGLNQVVRVHLAALNIDPDSVKWALQMSAPSAIFEMQQVEVWNARAALAAALQPFFTSPWIMANIFHLSDEDALFASEAKANEAEAQALAQASVQADIMQRFPELGPEGALALGAPTTGGEMMGGSPGMGGAGGAPAEGVDPRLDKALQEVRQMEGRLLRAVERTGGAVDGVAKRLRRGAPRTR